MSTYILVNRDLTIELADEASGFRRFKKQICKFGEYVDPHGAGKMVLDKTVADTMKANFDSGKYGAVAVPLGHPRTPAELAALNKGEVIELSVTDDGIDAVIEVRDDETVDRIEKRLIPDVSMGFEDNYLDKRTGKNVGPLLKHVGLVADPYIKGMRQFMPLADDMPAILFSDSQINKEDATMGTVKIKNDREFDVEVKYTADGEEKIETVAAGAEIEVPADQEKAVKQQIAEAEEPKATEESEELKDELSDENKKAKELSDRELALAAREAELNKREAEAKFDKLLSDGKVVPAQKEAFMALSELSSHEIHLSDDETKTVDTLLSEFIAAAPKIELTDEKGVVGEDDNRGGDDVELSEADRANIDRFNLSENDYKEVKQSKEQK